MSTEQPTTNSSAQQREQYLKEQQVPRFVNSFVETLLASQPQGADGVAAAAVKHGLEQCSSDDARLKAIEPFLPPQPTTTSAAMTPRDATLAVLSANLSFAGQDQSRSVRTSGPRATDAFSAIAHNMAIDVLHQSSLAGAAHRASIVNYNRGQTTRTEPWYRQFTKVCATVGPASASREVLASLVDAGATIFRLNFSFGSRESFREMVVNIRAVERQIGRELTIVMDHCGPEVRLGNAPNGGALELRRGDKITLSTREEFAEKPTQDTVFVDYKQLPQAVTYSSRILVSEGNLELRVIEIGDDFVECVVESRHFVLHNHRNVNLPGVAIGLPIVSERDKHQIDFAVDELGVDGIFLSFVQSADDIREVNAHLGPRKEAKGIFLFAKIENQEGLQNFDAILELVDGIMVARGDLGAELPVKKLFLAQKMLISKCNAKGKPVIVAAQLLESMTTNPHPTRAEANDVANAVLDGADCLQLSAETAVGENPEATVTVLSDIAAEAHLYIHKPQFFQSMLAVQPHPMPPEESVASSAVNSAIELGAKAIIALTTSGSSATLVSKYLPPCPVIAVCKKRETAKKLNLVRGVTPYYYEGVGDDDRQTRIDKTIVKMRELAILEKGDIVLAVHADTTTNYANLCRVLEVD